MEAFMRTPARRVVSAIILISLLFTSALAQENPRIYITAVSIPGQMSEEQSTLTSELTKAFEVKHAVISWNIQEWTLVVDVLTLDSARYVVALVLLEGLPEATVEFAKENEVFYLSRSQEERKKLPPEGKVVREYMSEEFIRQYGLPVDSQISILKREDLSTFASRIAQDFYVKFIY